MPDPTQPWPTSVPDAPTLLAYFAGRGLWADGIAEALVPRLDQPDADQRTPLRFANAAREAVSCFATHFLLTRLHNIDAGTANEVAAVLWRTIETGDTVPEYLWQEAAAAGLDTAAIQASGLAVGSRP